MTRNMGILDRGLRVMLGALFILGLIFGYTSGVLGWILAALGAVFILTALVGHCPLYRPFGLNTGGDG